MSAAVPMSEAEPSNAPHAAAFRAQHRGGGLFTETVNQWLASYLSVVAYRLGLPPTVITLINLTLGVGASVGVAVLAPYAAAGDVPAWLVGLGALLIWQVAYTLDCSDGQLARVTGQANPAGARVDILADVAVQISLVTALSAVASAYRPGPPAWLIALFAGTWMVNLVTSILQRGATSASLVSSTSPAVRLVKLIRDYGAVVAACGLVMAFAPGATVWLMVAFSVVNGMFLVASTAQAASSSLRGGPEPP